MGRPAVPAIRHPALPRKAEAKGMRQLRERRHSAAAKNRQELLRKVHPGTAAGHGLGSCPEQAARRHMPGGQQLRSTLEGPTSGERRSSAAAQPREWAPRRAAHSSFLSELLSAGFAGVWRGILLTTLCRCLSYTAVHCARALSTRASISAFFSSYTLGAVKAPNTAE